MRFRIALFSLLAVLLVPAGAAASPSAGEPERAAAGFWTPERMREAIPMPLPRNGATDLEPAVAAGQAGAARRGGIRAEQIPNPSARSVRMHGKAFFQMGGTSYVCSGTVVGSKTKSTVWTAGHCVEKGRNGGFARRWIFVPAYADGQAPFGQWTARKLATTPGWGRSGDLSYDIGAAKVGKRDGKPIAAVVGDRGIRFRSNPPKRITAYGYPSRPNTGTGQAFDGERGRRCDTRRSGRQQAGLGPKTIQIGCDMTAGASGGGWLSPGGKLVSVTSYTLGREGTASRSLFGPQMGSVARRLFKTISR